MPGKQSIQRAEFEGDQLPGRQVKHSVEAGSEYDPAEQALQAVIDSAPAVRLYVPAAHDEQLKEPLNSA